LNGGNALATTVAAPLGSFLGQYIGWRGAFFAVVPLAAITLMWQFLSLPALPPKHGSRGNALVLLRNTQARYGIAAVTLFFMGQFALFTYLRPFLETVTRVNVSTLSLILLIIGGAGLLGTYLIGSALKRMFHSLLIGMPLAMAAIAVALIPLGSSPAATALLLAGWGLIGTAAPVAWWTWLSRTLPDEAEAGGGLMVAAIQLAITLGAATGGWLFDSRGYESTFGVSAALLTGSALIAIVASRGSRQAVSEVP
jgi:predicted MFS family arabinose efflux permease